jgi:Protein of unknown function (DUF2795)
MATFDVTEVQRHLKGAQYPASGDELAKLAGDNGAEESLVEALRSIEDADGPDEVMKQLRGQLRGTP